TLYQFPISHYCEKARWHLEHKGLSYQRRDVLPGLHVGLVPRTKPGARPTVPMLVDGDERLGDSTAIAPHLEARYPERPLLPANAEDRARALAVGSFFDEEVGPHARRLLYGVRLREPGAVSRAMFAGYASITARIARVLLGPLLERGIRRLYEIDEATVAVS